MSITCNGVCHRYRAKKPVGMGRYASGQKRCNSCEIFIHWAGLWCPCCNYKPRLRPRSSKFKIKYQNIKDTQKEILVNGM